VLVDTHCHLDDAPLAGALGLVMARARLADVGHVIVPGVRPAQWAALGAMVRANHAISLALGIHPQCLPELSDDEVSEGLGRLRAEARSLGAVAIGECGFDGETAHSGVSLERQGATVRAHCAVADELGLPLIVHVVGAMGFALGFFESLGPRRHGAVLHAFAGPVGLGPRWVALGFSFGIGPSITWSRSRRPKEAARVIPVDRLLLETDGPGTYIEGAADRVGEPAQVRDVVRALSAIRGEDEDLLAGQTTANAARLFGERLRGPR